ncbi:MAG: biotin--[acetyl-CoA-carboxylase] ligase [Treponema sp.]|nr:biotin--[acetyl-CoA-carboxylase] ligase [Treponema sp.]
MEDLFDAQSFWDFFSRYESACPLKKELVSIYDVIDSTNTELMRRVQAAGYDNLKTMHRMLVASAAQTAGKGRVGRSFYSPEKSGIYFSFLYAPEECITDPARYTVASVVGVCRAIEALYDVETQIKWVNDIYVRGKKVCGILTEGVFNPVTSVIDAVIVGIGINIVTDGSMPEELQQKAGGIVSAGNALPVSRAELLARVIYEIYNILDNKLDYMSDYRRRFMHAGKMLTVSPLIGDDKSCYDAVALGISDDAGLIVRLEDGSEKILHSGEVSLHGMKC